MKPNDFDLRKTYYQEYSNMFRHQESLIFQRFNYFLIGNSFLTIAFVTLSTNAIQSINEPFYQNLNALALLLGLAGFLISWFFTAINLHNAKIIKMIGERLRYLEKNITSNKVNKSIILPYNTTFEKLNSEEFNFDMKTLLIAPPKHIASLFFKKTGNRELPAPHTWMAPFCFSIFWIIAIILYYFRPLNLWILIIEILFLLLIL